jgi:VanZ family protein
MNPLLFRRLLFWAVLLFSFVMAILPQPPDIPGQPGDKVQHIAAFATLGLLGSWAYAAMSRWTLFAGLSLYGALIEVVQAVPVIHRDSDVRDWVADTVAAGAVLLLVAYWRTRRRGNADADEPLA